MCLHCGERLYAEDVSSRLKRFEATYGRRNLAILLVVAWLMNGNSSRNAGKPGFQRKARFLGILRCPTTSFEMQTSIKQSNYRTAASTGSSACFSALLVLMSILIVTPHSPWALPRTCQWGWTVTDWWINSKPPSDWLTVSIGKVQ